jgi:OmpA-OmpF porin, OOP family
MIHFFYITCFAAAGLLPAAVFAQEDVENAKEITYFSRMPKFDIIDSVVKDFDSYQFYDGKRIISVEGRFHQNRYKRPEDAGPVISLLQIRRNFSAALKAAGGAILFEGTVEQFDDTRSSSDILWGRFTKNGREVWVEIWPYAENDYYITLIEKQVMRQDVNAEAMLHALNRSGHVALYILFDTGKSIIKPESEPIIDEIVSLLQQNPDLHLSVEGHTDNVGTAAGNKSLSESRAAAVLAAIVKKGMEGKRLTSLGWGQDKPVADNGTEEGRAKNRRVELVKK